MSPKGLKEFVCLQKVTNLPHPAHNGILSILIVQNNTALLTVLLDTILLSPI
jgi:hypothetical protein